MLKCPIQPEEVTGNQKALVDFRGSGQQLYDLTHIQNCVAQKYPSEVISEQFNFIEDSMRKTFAEKEECPLCLNTGIYNQPNGEDDFDKEYCDCEIGQKLEIAAKEDDEDYKSECLKGCLCDKCMTEGDRLHDERSDNELQDELE